MRRVRQLGLASGDVTERDLISEVVNRRHPEHAAGRSPYQRKTRNQGDGHPTNQHKSHALRGSTGRALKSRERVPFRDALCVALKLLQRRVFSQAPRFLTGFQTKAQKPRLC